MSEKQIVNTKGCSEVARYPFWLWRRIHATQEHPFSGALYWLRPATVTTVRVTQYIYSDTIFASFGTSKPRNYSQRGLGAAAWNGDLELPLMSEKNFIPLPPLSLSAIWRCIESQQRM